MILLIGTIIPLFELPNTSGDLINPSVLTQHNAIYIDGDSDFTSANGVVSGSGIKSDPYIIENWSISASNAHGILIENTNAFFKIRNCS